MKQAFGLVRRPWGVFYLKNKITGQQTSLKTSDKHEAQRILQAHNESEVQPHFNLSLARVYLNGADPKLATRTWQDVMQDIVAKKKDETRRRWEVASKDRNFDCILRGALANLPAAYSVVFRLREMESLSTAETGERLGLTTGCVKTRLLRARLMLRQTMAPALKRAA